MSKVFLKKVYIDYDPELSQSLERELERQNQIEMIASKNFVSRSVLEAQGSVLQINMQKVILEKDIMVDVNLQMKLKLLQLKEQKNCLMRIMSMFNLILVLKLIKPFF